MGVVSKKWYVDVKKGLIAAGFAVNLSDDEWLIFGRSWQTAEGGTAEHDAWNTTQKEASSTNYNTVPVQNYPNEEEGVKATIATLTNGNYDTILKGFKDNADPYFLAVMVGQSPWGTNIELFVRVLADNYDYGATR